jgi:hypothetical protein
MTTNSLTGISTTLFFLFLRVQVQIGTITPFVGGFTEVTIHKSIQILIKIEFIPMMIIIINRIA